MTISADKINQIKLVIFDVDGVLTNGHLHVTPDGIEHKIFHVHDGLGIVMLLRTGVEVAVISGMHSDAVSNRLQKLGIKHIYLGQSQKIGIYEELLARLHLVDDQVIYVGDDLPDRPLLQRAGIGIAVANASPWVKEIADWQTTAAGGYGAVREVCDWLMQGQGTFAEQLQFYEKS
jgi:3-deoxy-D-manno-octulosonate 8-phosphate phosphatase (KDO 8-P phosphatase)